MSSKTQSAQPGLSVRNKSSDLENTLPAVAELIGDAKTNFGFVDLDGEQQYIDFRPYTVHDPQPLPMPIDREGYCNVEASPRYWATGLGDWLNVKDAMGRFLPDETTDRPVRIMDFGCATGRFLRHPWVERSEMNLDLWGCDFSPQNVEWSKQHLDRDIKIILNHSMPSLPFPDGYFDVVTAFSVFTHIDSFEDAWLLELRRITRNDGMLYLTIQNEASWDAVLGRATCLDHLMNANKIPGNIEVNEKLFQSPMTHDRLVLRMSAQDVYNCTVWHSSKYVQENWGRFFDVQHIANCGHNSYQSPVILKPNSDTGSDHRRLPR